MTETDALPPPEPAKTDDGPRFIRSLKLTNLLSFGPAGEEIELRNLNVLVGANGSGKTNFVEALAVLAACPSVVGQPFQSNGGLISFVNYGAKYKIVNIRATSAPNREAVSLTHAIGVAAEGQRLVIADEHIFGPALTNSSTPTEVFYAHHDHWRSVVDSSGTSIPLVPGEGTRNSVLSLLRDSDRFPEITRLQKIYSSIRLYRNWIFGPDSSLRKPQAADLPNEWLAEDYGNLFLILNRMEFEPEAKGEFLERLRDFLPDVTDYKLQIVGGTILMFLIEGRNAVPATRLSDGTLRWLCLLAILVAPSPPGVIVLEEPELGLHPDMINTLADMLKKAATRHQLVITTHSDILIDALSDVPEAVMVVEKGEEGTTVRRLDAETLAPWLEEYRLGRIWMQGQIGGTRW